MIYNSSQIYMYEALRPHKQSVALFFHRDTSSKKDNYYQTHNMC